VGLGTVKLFLCLTEYHAMKTCSGSGGKAPLILRPRHYMEVSGQLCPLGKRPRYTWIVGWVGPRVGLGGGN
jgi:hypothetical protein